MITLPHAPGAFRGTAPSPHEHGRPAWPAPLGLAVPSALRAALRPAFRHIVFPLAVVVALLWAYYAGGPALADLVAPPINRELGVLEHLQALVLLAASAAGARAAWAARGGAAPRALRAGLFVALAAGALLAEELDYGRHHLQLLVGDPAAWAGAPPALHNRAVGADHQVVDYMKQAANVGLALWFVLAPLAPARWRGALLRRGLRVPAPWYAATVGVFAAVSELAHRLQRASEQGGAGWRPLDGNVAEFGELVVYYLLALYAVDVLRSAAGLTDRESVRTAADRAPAAQPPAGPVASPAGRPG